VTQLKKNFSGIIIEKHLKENNFIDFRNNNV